MQAFLMTDIEGSTRLWEQEPQAMSEALARHESILVQTAPRFGGRVIKSKGEGDAAFLVFPTALGAVQCAAELQRLFEVEKWPGTPILVRMACHVGLAEMRDEDYFGTTINKCARLRAIAYGGQVLLSNDAKEQLPAEHPLLDLGIHRLRDLQRPERVFQLLTDGLRSSFPALRSLEAFPNNLPSQRNAFVAREKELRKAAELLESCRLLTLTGIGGGGKTRLALQAGAELLPQFPDGVWFIDLAPLHDGRLVPQVTAEALSIREAPGKSVSEALLNYLSDRKLLLILDNCEHVVEAAAELADLFLARCPNVRLVATSREPLNIAGESVLRVPPLSIPDSSEDLEAIKRSESVQLFTEKARESNHAFELTSENSEAVAEICRRLDGIPLALELAAARLRSASPQQISSRLTERFRLLTGGSRVALPRQQTLQALIDWSHDLLSPAEKQMLSRVSVFAGGWTIAAAEAVCAGGEIDELDVFDLLTSLVDRSLVVPSELGGEMVRYTLLETVREYAAGKLSQSGEGETLRRRHHEYFTAFAAAAEGKLFGPEGQTLQKQLQQEHDNFREAMRLALPDEAIRLAGSLWRLWYAAGYLAEGRRMLTRALESYVGPVTESLAKCQTGYGAMSWRSLDLQEAEDTTLKALASWGELEDEAG
ncbi:MAG TPA: hypothetical protein VEX38_10000, partial [Fimbriimonadaceae bacterium]|nr:hypothetical protein [Fimbriimonadaceae bacterium]